MREGREFRRRVWREQRSLAIGWLACSLGVGVLGWVQLLTSPEPDWANRLSLALLVVAFVLFVLVVRRDEPPEER